MNRRKGIARVMVLCLAILQIVPQAAASTISDANMSHPEGHDNRAAYAAYADILEEYHDFMFYRESARQDLDESKVALFDVYGDDTPELLFLYRKEMGSENPRIYTYSKDEGATLLFDDRICTFAAGGGNYCLYTSSDGALMAYCSARDTHYEWGFWNV